VFPREVPINSIIWCAVGALIGAAAALAAPRGRIALIESLLVGVFGAFIGGDFLVAMLSDGVVSGQVFRLSSLGMAVAGAVVLLAALRLMRGAVGPMRGSRSKASRRRS